MLPAALSSQRARIVILGLFGTGLAFFLFGGAESSKKSSDPNDAVPRDSYLALSLNLAELRRSPLHAVLLGDPSQAGGGGGASIGSKALGIGKLAEACGFDPLSRVDQLAVAIPEEGDKGELGLAARVTVSRDELQKCTSALADQRGGKVATKDVGSFVVVEDSASDTTTVKPRLAYGHGNLLVAGRGAWFDAMLDAADGKKPNIKAATSHLAMRSALTSREGWRSPTLVVTALLPRQLRDRLKDEMGAEIGSKDNSQKIMAGVLGVSSVGLALKAGERGQNTDLAIELGCDTAEGCEAVEKLVLKKRLDWGKELSLRMVGLGPLLDSIDVKRDGARLRVTASAPAEALAQTIDRIIRLKSSRSSDDGPAFPGLPSRNTPTQAPDETIPAKKLDSPR